MTFAARLTRSPDPYEPERGRETADLLPGLPSELRNLVAGTAGCSPFLKGLIERDPAWLEQVLTGRPEAALAGIMGQARSLPPTALKPGLRLAKRRLALLVAMADLGGIWSLQEVTGALTGFADLAVDRAMTAMAAAEVARGKLPRHVADDPATAGGMVALAMGKMGAAELNYSSDIDLIVLFDGDRYDADSYHEARSALVRATRKMTAILAETTGDGYVFRTDLRLRPDASVTPVCLSMDAAESYYEDVGRTWERAAYIKARPCAGDVRAGNRFLERLAPFVWRKHLDFAAIQDAHDMRLRIREHMGFHPTTRLEGHNIKLGSGGIREIEFFVQTRQLIAGGRDPSLRQRGTIAGLARLVAAGWVDADTAATLTQAYRAHREVEHRLQMIADAQTHTLPADVAGFDRLAAFLGETASDLRAGLADRLAEVHGLTEGFFAPDATRATPEIDPATQAVVDHWRNYPALRTHRAARIFDRLKPEILSRLGKAAKPREALDQFDAFLAGLPAGVQLFSLFSANPQLIDLIVDIAATSPALAHYLGRNSQVFDAVIGGSFFDPWPGRAALEAALGAYLATFTDYEAQLDAVRRWRREWHFRIGVHHLRGLIDAAEAGCHYADLAGAVLGALWGPVVAAFAARHGDPPGRGAVVLGMGSLGAEQLSSTSDLDLIVIYDAAGTETSDGPRPLAVRVYFARLTQAYVTALSAPMAEGTGYEVDMRLRPSGKKGPVATSFDAFRAYQLDEAWTWEHLALTRARPVAGRAALGHEVEQFRRGLLARPSDPARVLADVADMRTRIAAAKQVLGPFEAKQGTGRMQDIELLAQAAAVVAGDPSHDVADQLAAAHRLGWLDRGQQQSLGDTYSMLWRVQVAALLLTGVALDFGQVGEGGRSFMLRQTGTESVADLAARVASATTAAAVIVDSVLEPRP